MADPDQPDQHAAAQPGPNAFEQIGDKPAPAPHNPFQDALDAMKAEILETSRAETSGQIRREVMEALDGFGTHLKGRLDAIDELLGKAPQEGADAAPGEKHDVAALLERFNRLERQVHGFIK